MAGFSLRRRKFAPSGVALEASHEAAGAGLVAGFMFTPGSNSLVDLCGNQWVELFRHAHAVNPLTGKPALLSAASVGRMQLPNGLRLLSRTAGSVAISSRITGYTGGYPRRLQTPDDSRFRLARLAADNQVTVHLFGSNVDIPTTAPYYTTGQSVMGLSWDASHPTIKRGLYREGVLVGSSGTAPGSDTEDRYIQLDGGAGEVDWMFFFDRAVDQQALFDDPMALVRARRQVLYFDAGGGVTHNQNLSAISDATQAVLESRLSMARILSATGLSVLSLDKNISSTKLASSTHSGVIAKRSNVSKSTSSTSSSEMFRASSVSRALSAIANNLATLTRTATQSKALSSVSSAATSVVKGVRKTANASSTALATFVRTLTKSMYTAASNLASIASQPLAGLQYRTITAASTSVSYIVKSIRSVKLVQSTSDATISSLKSFYRIFSATSTSALTLSKGLQSRLSVIASSTATMIRESGQSVTMLAQSIGAATIRRLNVIQKAVISSSTSSINRAISAYRSLTTSSVGLGVLNKLRYRTESVTSAAIASVTAVYTSVTSQIRVIIDKTSNFVRIKSITSLFTRSKDKDARF